MSQSAHPSVSLPNEGADRAQYKETDHAKSENVDQVSYKEADQAQYKKTDHVEPEKVDETRKQLNQSGHTFAKYNGEAQQQTKQKKHSSALHGHIYQLKLLMLFLVRGVARKYCFRLGTEIKEAEKFDDLVFEYLEDGKKVYRLLQAKHKIVSSTKIRSQNLLSIKEDYSLVKYFVSYQISKRQKLFKAGSIKDLIIYTNIDWDYEDLESNGIRIEEIRNENDLLDVKDSEKKTFRYKFHETVLTLLMPKLRDYSATRSAKESIKYTDNEAKDFLDHLVFAVNQPNENELGKIIRKKIGTELNYINPGNTYNRLLEKMTDWFLDANSDRFLSYEKAKEFLKAAGIRFNIKSPTHTFVGRVEQLNDLHIMLQDQNEKQRQFISISGLGGVGKSELVKQYIKEYSRQYDNNIIWINAESYSTLAESFRTLARDKLRISTMNADNNEKETRSIVEDVYKYLSEGKCLFIFDNAEKYKSDNEFDHGIANFLPSVLPGHNRLYILITSRNNKWPENVHVLQLDVFNEDEATEFVEKSLTVQKDIQEDDINELVRQLHCLPLALQQAVTYIKLQDQKLKNIGKLFDISDYLKKFMEKAADVLNFNFSESTSNDYTKTIFTTWNVTLDVIKQNKDGTNALQILYVASYLAPEDIPTDMFSGIIKDQEDIAAAIELLKQYSMVNVEHARINVHRIVQKVIRMKLKQQEMEEKFLEKVLHLFYVHGVKWNNINHAASLWTHTNECSTLARISLPLLNRIAQALMNIYRFREAYSVLEEILQLLSTKQTNFAIDSVIELNTKNDMGVVCIYLGKYEKACHILQEVLARLESNSGYEHRMVKINLAYALHCKGCSTEALKHCEELLYDMQVRSESEQLNVMEVQILRAKVLLNENKIEEARLLFSAVYKWQESKLGKYDHATLDTRRLIAKALMIENKFKEAAEILTEICNVKNMCSETYKHCIARTYDLGETCLMQRQYNAALKIFQNILCAQQEVLEADHPNVLSVQLNIVEALTELGKFDEALKVHQDIINNHEGVLRPDHPKYLHTLRTKAHIFDRQEKCSSALKLYQKILKKQITATGPGHADILTVRSIIAKLHLSEGNYDQALATSQDVYRLQRNLIGENHLDALYTNNNIGMALYHKKEYDSALHIFQENYDKLQALYPDHPSKYMTLSNIGLILASRRQYSQALKLHKEVLGFIEVYFGKDHLDTMIAKNNIVGTLVQQGKYTESLELVHDVYKGVNKVFGPNNTKTMHTRNLVGTVLLHAINNNDVEEIKHFFERDADITVANFDSTVLLHHTVNKSKADILNILLKNGGDPTLISEGKTALHVAASKNCAEVVKVLLRYMLQYRHRIKKNCIIKGVIISLLQKCRRKRNRKRTAHTIII